MFVQIILTLCCITSVSFSQFGIIFADNFTDLSQWTIQRQSGSYIRADPAPSWCTTCDGGVVRLAAAGSSWYDSIRQTTIDTTGYSGPFYINIDFYMYGNQWGHFYVKASCEALPSYTTMREYLGEYTGDSNTVQQNYINEIISIDPSCTGSQYIGLELRVWTSSIYEYTYVDSIRLCSGYSLNLCGTFPPTFAPTQPTTLSPTVPTSSPTKTPSFSPTTAINGVIFYDDFINLNKWSILRQQGSYIYLAETIPVWCIGCNGTVILRAGPSSWYDSIVTNNIDISPYKPPFVININFYLYDYKTAYFYIKIRCEGYGYTTIAQWRNSTMPAYTPFDYLNQLIHIGPFCDNSTWIGIQLMAYTSTTQQSVYVDDIKLCSGYGADLCGTTLNPTVLETEQPTTSIPTPPSISPTNVPSISPTTPSISPTKAPSISPSQPSNSPTTLPTVESVVPASCIKVDCFYTVFLVFMIVITFQ